MTKETQKDILSRVQDLGEEALQRLAEVPGGSRLVEMANQTRTRLDDLQKRVRGLEGLEERVAKLEQQMAAQTTAAGAPTLPAATSPATGAGTGTESGTSADEVSPPPTTPTKPPA